MSIYIDNFFDLVSISPHQDATSLQSIIIGDVTFPSLETFEVSDCPNLRSFPSLRGVGSCLRSLIISCGDEVLPTGLQSCTSLSKLIIECPNLISIPELRELHSLMEFRIFDCYNLKSIPDLRELHSFTHLCIVSCKKFMRLPDELKCVTRLKSLVIGRFCEELDAFPSLSSIQHLHMSLDRLILAGWEKLNSLPDEIQ